LEMMEEGGRIKGEESERRECDDVDKKKAL
jgi:hypothetical protein